MGPHRDLPAYDEPPTYSDVPGIVTQETKMDKYKNKGKEILAKVTYYRNTTLPKFQQNWLAKWLALLPIEQREDIQTQSLRNNIRFIKIPLR